MGKGKLLLAGLAAYAFYKYNKMSEMEKRDMANKAKAKGQRIYEKYVPEEVKNLFGKKETPGFGSTYPETDPYSV